MRKLTVVPFLVLGLILAMVALYRRSMVQVSKAPHQQRKIETAAGKPAPMAPDVRPPARSTRPRPIVQPDWETESVITKRLETSGPEARMMFEKGLEYLGNGDFFRARVSFTTLGRTYRQDSARPLADWAVGLALYKEGGIGNLTLAADAFNRFYETYSGSPALQSLVQVAVFDRAFIESEIMYITAAELDMLKMEAAGNEQVNLMKVVLKQKEMVDAGRSAVKSLQLLLVRWRYSPYAPSARALLSEVQRFIAAK